MSDLTQSGAALLFNLVNTANPSLHNGPLSATNVTIGVPAAAAAGHTDNTDVTLTAIEGQGYTGSVTINYNRIDIGAMFTAKSETPTVTGGANYHNASDLLAPLNSAYALDLVAADITDEALTGTVPYTYTLKIASGSLTYTGQVDVQINA